MKQVLQSLKDGTTLIEDVPCPMVKSGHVLIRTHKTLVSVGTEKMLLDFGKANLIQKARQQPDKVRMVLDKVKTDGLVPTYESVQNKLDQPIPMGYCNVGTVMEVGAGVTEFKVGDRVASNGHHAEVVLVPKNLCAKIPDNVSDEAAAFTVISSIALQGIRLVNPTYGETVVVLGLGLVGLLTVQLLRANGCHVLGADFDSERVRLAEQYGAVGINLGKGEDPVMVALRETNSRGVDAVIVAASTPSNDPMRQAATMCRQRGRVVLVGVVGLELSRADFYEKEITFQVSCSYGPGRYDSNYEEGGNDYPLGFVRWTEQRNFEAILQGLSHGTLDVESLITHRYKLPEAGTAYSEVTSGGALGVLLECDIEQPEATLKERHVKRSGLSAGDARQPEAKLNVAMIGAGNYASKVLIPAFVEAGAGIGTIVSSGGVTGVATARKYNIEKVATDTEALFADQATNALVVATRHDTHADYACRALAAGKHLFVEKPLALNAEELASVKAAYAASRDEKQPPLLMVGFNRRFSPLVQTLHKTISNRSEPITVNMTINAGMIPADSWVQNLQQGGGRIIGEGCHFVDLARFLVGTSITSVNAIGMANSADGIATDKALMQIGFEDGSIASIQYLANGSSAFPKERIEVFSEGRVFQIDNFRALRSWGAGGDSEKLWRQDKGNSACVAAFVNAVRNGSAAPISFDELVEVTEATFAIHRQICGAE